MSVMCDEAPVSANRLAGATLLTCCAGALNFCIFSVRGSGIIAGRVFRVQGISDSSGARTVGGYSYDRTG